jgi:hypothetical protein
LYLVEKGNDFGTPDLDDRPVTERWENGAFEIAQSSGCGSDIAAERHLIAVAPHASFDGHVSFSDGAECSGRDGALFDLGLLFGEGGVATFLGLVKRSGCRFAGRCQRH